MLKSIFLTFIYKYEQTTYVIDYNYSSNSFVYYKLGMASMITRIYTTLQ